MHLEIKEPTRNYVISAWLIAAALLWFVLRFDLLPALLAGLLVFELVHVQTLRLTFCTRTQGQSLGGCLSSRGRGGFTEPGDFCRHAVLP